MNSIVNRNLQLKFATREHTHNTEEGKGKGKTQRQATERQKVSHNMIGDGEGERREETQTNKKEEDRNTTLFLKPVYRMVALANWFSTPSNHFSTFFSFLCHPQPSPSFIFTFLLDSLPLSFTHNGLFFPNRNKQRGKQNHSCPTHTQGSILFCDRCCACLLVYVESKVFHFIFLQQTTAKTALIEWSFGREGVSACAYY